MPSIIRVPLAIGQGNWWRIPCSHNKQHNSIQQIIIESFEIDEEFNAFVHQYEPYQVQNYYLNEAMFQKLIQQVYDDFAIGVYLCFPFTKQLFIEQLNHFQVCLLPEWLVVFNECKHVQDIIEAVRTKQIDTTEYQNEFTECMSNVINQALETIKNPFNVFDYNKLYVLSLAFKTIFKIYDLKKCQWITVDYQSLLPATNDNDLTTSNTDVVHLCLIDGHSIGRLRKYQQ